MGFFLSDFQYLDSDDEILEYFKNHRSEIPLCINDITNLLNDNTLEWNTFSNEANIFFESHIEFTDFIIWLRSELTSIIYP